MFSVNQELTFWLNIAAKELYNISFVSNKQVVLVRITSCKIQYVTFRLVLSIEQQIWFCFYVVTNTHKKKLYFGQMSAIENNLILKLKWSNWELTKNNKVFFNIRILPNSFDNPWLSNNIKVNGAQQDS